ncbi:MAG: DUF975 family protein [Ruminococcaceae bacterium]|nr:DUF975 family protein [Oscillospiraceae bacterium]
MNRVELKENAKQQIKGKIGILFAITLIMVLVTFGGSLVLSFIPFVGSVASLIVITAPLTLGYIMVYLKVANGQNVEIGDLFKGYQDLWCAFKTQFFVGLFTGLWSLLFVIPGIIKGISYSMAYYILAENPGMGALEAINRSKAMMEGHKMDYFVLTLSFYGWFLLSYITCGIVGIWAIPYMATTYANFYNKIKNTGNEVNYVTETIQ